MREKVAWIVILILVVFTGIIWSAVFDNSDKEFVIAFLDVGQGDATYIEAPNGNQILIDGGADKKILERLGEVIPFYDRSIDVILATHPDKDHIGGLPFVFENFDVGYYISTNNSSESADYTALQKSILDEGVQEILARRGTIVDLGEGTYMEILFPDRDVSGLESNTSSVIVRVVSGDRSIMLTGDSPKSIEEYLVSQYGENLEADILKVGHHGSKTSSAESFVSLVDPEIAVISAGEDNRYGHPHDEVVEKYEKKYIKLLNTASMGNVIFSNGKLK